MLYSSLGKRLSCLTRVGLGVFLSKRPCWGVIYKTTVMIVIIIINIYPNYKVHVAIDLTAMLHAAEPSIISLFLELSNVVHYILVLYYITLQLLYDGFFSSSKF